MPRNLDKRVEILFPVEDPILQEEIYHILHMQLSDTKKSPPSHAGWTLREGRPEEKLL